MTNPENAKTMLITGAGRGIGAATARLAASRGYHVAINYRQQADQAQTLCNTIKAQGGQCFTVQADVSRSEEIERLFELCDAQFGQLDVLINNAGIVAPSIRLDTLDAERLHRLFDTNILSAMLCSKAAVRRMSTHYGGQGGAIVNISSVAALLGSANEYIDYASTKAAVDTLTIGLSKEVVSEGIRVNAVRPGIIDTDIHASGGEPNRVARVAPNVPMQRAGTAEEVAYAALWLASDEASYVTGSFINVSGGR